MLLDKCLSFVIKCLVIDMQMLFGVEHYHVFLNMHPNL